MVAIKINRKLSLLEAIQLALSEESGIKTGEAITLENNPQPSIIMKSAIADRNENKTDLYMENIQ
jgi:hypothetical protein